MPNNVPSKAVLDAREADIRESIDFLFDVMKGETYSPDKAARDLRKAAIEARAKGERQMASRFKRMAQIIEREMVK